MAAVGIVGPGRAGLGLGLALAQAGHAVHLHGRRQKPVPSPLTLTIGAVPPWLAAVDVVILAVPDDAVPNVAGVLARSGSMGPGHVALHLSGALDHTALQRLAPTGAALGSLHPLLSFGDPVAAPGRLRNAHAALEGGERAMATAAALAASVGLTCFRLAGGQKATYHAGAVFGANFLVTLYATAEQLFLKAGIAPEQANLALTALMAGVLDNIRERGAKALTGPVARGDVESIRRHLAALEGQDAVLYRELSRATLEIAELEDERRRAIVNALDAGDDRRR